MQYQSKQSRSRSNREFSETSNDTQPIPSRKVCYPDHQRRNSFSGLIRLPALMLIALILTFAANVHAKNNGKLHTIALSAQALGDGMFAYQMDGHIISKMNGDNAVDVTSNYPGTPTIPGPTIVINEGDEVALTLSHEFTPGSDAENQVSVHVHGVHYDITSDGTIEFINLWNPTADQDDQSAISRVQTFTYHWVAAPGTAGTWAYHDHNMLTLNGAEDRGLFGALIVNNKSRARTKVLNTQGKPRTLPLSRLKKDYVLFIGDDAFWGTEIDAKSGQQSSVGTNPTLNAQQGKFVRFHLIALGTNFHNFTLPGYSWSDPGTNLFISEKEIGPLEKHVFTVRAGNNSSYMDTTFSSKALGMMGDFNVAP